VVAARRTSDLLISSSQVTPTTIPRTSHWPDGPVVS
jgi:hypothetical protein